MTLRIDDPYLAFTLVDPGPPALTVSGHPLVVLGDAYLFLQSCINKYIFTSLKSFANQEHRKQLSTA